MVTDSWTLRCAQIVSRELGRVLSPPPRGRLPYRLVVIGAGLLLIFIGGLALRTGTMRGTGDEAVRRTTTTTTTPDLVWQNPVIATDFPDPDVVREGGRYAAFATNGPGGRIQVATSEDLSNWTIGEDALGEMPVWAAQDPHMVWAPAAVRLNGRWLMFATFKHAASGRQCVGQLAADAVEGPYEPVSGDPFLCPLGQGGAIDPAVFVERGEAWLLWKVDGNCCGKSSLIRSQRLAADGRSLVGEPATLLGVDQDWERGPVAQQQTIEGPALARLGGRLVLLYSANGYAGERYALGQAVCETVSGPCHKSGVAPILATSGDVVGPGGASLFRDDEGRDWIAYHAWSSSAIGYGNGGVRAMHLAPVVLVDDRLVVMGPTTEPLVLGPRSVVPETTRPRS